MAVMTWSAVLSFLAVLAVGGCGAAFVPTLGAPGRSAPRLHAAAVAAGRHGAAPVGVQMVSSSAAALEGSLAAVDKVASSPSTSSVLAAVPPAIPALAIVALVIAAAAVALKWRSEEEVVDRDLGPSPSYDAAKKMADAKIKAEKAVAAAAAQAQAIAAKRAQDEAQAMNAQAEADAARRAAAEKEQVEAEDRRKAAADEAAAEAAEAAKAAAAAQEAAAAASQDVAAASSPSPTPAPPLPPSSPPPPTRPTLSLEEYEAAAANELGRDPRDAPPWITGNAQLLAELTATSSTPKPAFASSSEAIAPICTLADFEAAVGEAQRAGRILAIKFYSPSCRACLNIKPLYERMADGPMAEHVDFREVDADASKLLSSYANIKPLPVIHLYAHGELHETLPIHSKGLFEEYYARLKEIVLENWS